MKIVQTAVENNVIKVFPRFLILRLMLCTKILYYLRFSSHPMASPEFSPYCPPFDPSLLPIPNFFHDFFLPLVEFRIFR